MFDPVPLAVDFVERGFVRLRHPLRWRTSGSFIVVPAGFACDGASIPAFAWPFVGHPLSGRFLRAAILHDFEIRTRYAPSPVVHRRFYRALRSQGVGRFRAGLMYVCVRLFGPRW